MDKWIRTPTRDNNKFIKYLIFLSIYYRYISILYIYIGIAITCIHDY